MGVDQSKCVNLLGEAAYMEETYAVKRTSGATETGWHLVEEIPCAFLKKEGWTVHLQGEDEKRTHGWRVLGTFWPTRLTDDAAAIASWTETLRDRLEELAGRQGLPDVWEEHVCDMGAPPNYCPGCCGKKRALEKKALLDELDTIAAEQKSLEEKMNDLLYKKVEDGSSDDLEREEKQNIAQQMELDKKVYALQEKLNAIPNAATHREWLAERAAEKARAV
jgi:hypothetical protein